MTEFKLWEWEGKNKFRGVCEVRSWEGGRESEGYSDFRESELKLSEGGETVRDIQRGRGETVRDIQRGRELEMRDEAWDESVRVLGL